MLHILVVLRARVYTEYTNHVVTCKGMYNSQCDIVMQAAFHC